VDNHPKYGGSLSRSSVVHRSWARWKLALLNETQTPHSNSVPTSNTGMAMRARTKKYSAWMMHCSSESMLFGSLANSSRQ
jgi:hypothetical protein